MNSERNTKALAFVKEFGYLPVSDLYAIFKEISDAELMHDTLGDEIKDIFALYVENVPSFALEWAENVAVQGKIDMAYGFTTVVIEACLANPERHDVGMAALLLLLRSEVVLCGAYSVITALKEGVEGGTYEHDWSIADLHVLAKAILDAERRLAA